MSKWFLLYSKRDRGHDDFYLVLHPLPAANEDQARSDADRVWSQLVEAELRLWANRMQVDRAHAGTALSNGPREPRLFCEPDRPFRSSLREPSPRS